MLAYATGQPPLLEGPSYLAHDDATLSCNYVSSDHGTFDVHKPDYSPQCMRPVRGEWVRSTGPAEPNLLFLFLAFWPGLVAVGTMVGSWTLTGRPW